MTTPQNTSQDACSDRMTPIENQDQQSESKSGSQATDQFPPRIGELQNNELKGARQALDNLRGLAEDAEIAKQKANFDRLKTICRGMVAVYECALTAVMEKYPELNYED